MATNEFEANKQICTAVGQFWTCCLPDQVVTISDYTISKMAFGSKHCLFITEQGNVYSFGEGKYGQLGLGDTEDRLSEPCLIKCLHKIENIACGPYFSAALSSDGKIYMWGDNRNQQCGQEKPEKILSPTEIDFSNVSSNCEKCGILLSKNIAINKISCGAFHTLAISSDYELWTWGRELDFTSTNICYYKPKKVEFLKTKRVLSIACGYTHSLAVTEKDSTNFSSLTLCISCKSTSTYSNQVFNKCNEVCPLGLPVESEHQKTSEVSNKDDECNLESISENEVLNSKQENAENIDIAINSTIKQEENMSNQKESVKESFPVIESKNDSDNVLEENDKNEDAAVIPTTNSQYTTSNVLNHIKRRSSSLLDHDLAKEFLVRQFSELIQPVEKRHMSEPSKTDETDKKRSDWELLSMKSVVDKVKTTVDKFSFVSIGHRFSDSPLNSSQSSQESFEIIEVDGPSSTLSSLIVDDGLQTVKRTNSLKSVLEAKMFQKQKNRKGSLESLAPGYASHHKLKYPRKQINTRPCIQTEVWSWGEGKYGKLGHGDELNRFQPSCIKSLSGQGIVRVIAGSEHSVALTADCKVYTWGKNDCMQLGHSLSSKSVLTPKSIELSQHLVWDIAAGANHTLLLTDIKTTHIALFYCGSHDSANNSESCSCLKRRGLIQLNILKKSGLVTRIFAGGPYAGCVVDQQGIGEMPVLHEFAATERRYYNQLQIILSKVFTPMLKDDKSQHLLDISPIFADSVKSLIGQFAEMIDMVSLNANDLTLLVQGQCHFDSIYILENEEEWLNLYLNYIKSLSDVIAVNALTAYGKHVSLSVTSIAHNILGEIGLEQKSIPDILVHLLNIPIKRIMDYVRLFTRISAIVPKHIPDKEVNTTMLWKHISEIANRELHQAEITKLFWDNSPQKLVDTFRSPQRRLVKESRTLPLNLASSGRFSSHLFILFNDVFVHSQFGGLQSYPLQLVWVEPLPDSSNLQNAIVLTTPEEILTFTCPTSSEKTEWVCALNQSIKKMLDGEKRIEDTITWLTMNHRRLSPPLARHATYVFSKHSLYKDAKYAGMWLCGKLHGHGEMLWPDGRKYIGKFSQNMQHGEGLYMVPSGEQFITYEGYWKDGKQNGLGVVKYPNGDVYEGFFKDGYRHGHGVLKLGQFFSSAASVYIGQWAFNHRHGYGVMDDIRSGEKYMGMWQEDCKHGNGMVVTIDGIYYEGNFVMNKLSGYGVMIFEDNTCFEGELGAGGVLNGKGTLHLSNGDKIEGCFTGKCCDSFKIQGIYHKSQHPLTPISNFHDKKKTNLSSFGQLCVPADKKWEDIFGHCCEMLGVLGVNPKIDTERAWEAIAVAISKRKKELQSKKRSQLNQEDIDILERIPKIGIEIEKLTFDGYKEIEEYLQRASNFHFHPIGLLIEGLVDVYRATYLGIGAHPRLLPHAIAEINSFIKRTYSIIRILFPGLPHPDHPLSLNPANSDEWSTLSDVEKESNSIVATPASLLHPILLPRIYPPLFTLYALFNEKENEKYWERLLKWNKQSDVALMTFLGVDMKFWVTSDDDAIGERRQSLCKVKDKYFATAVETLQHISTAFTPLDKLKVIYQTFYEINKDVQTHLSSDFLWKMDDLFPVFQYVVVRARIRHLGSEIHLIDDLMERHLQNGEYGIMFTTLKACYFQIRTEKIDNN
ncbi:alsin [Centruroides vittatus]|uniref:alsin n=1 Tax=Centruroides vittatus TaxID=120091 RepID=UPI00350FC2A8